MHECNLICDEECSNFESIMMHCRPGAMSRNSLRFAGMMHSLADLTPQMPARERVRQLLAAKGYVTCEGHVRVEPLRHALASLFSDGFEDVRLNALIREVDIVATYLRAANSNRRAIHPVLIVLMEWLSMEAEHLLESRRRRPSDSTNEATDATLLSKKRAEWTAFQAQCHGLTRTEMRHRAPALWTWLHRHDATWLTCNQVSVQRTGRFRASRVLPAEVLERIRVNTRDFRYSADGLEPLPSAYQVRISYGMSVLAFNRAASRLNGAGVHAQLPARREVFVSRRVQQARVLLARFNEAVNESSIARRSRLRTDTINRHARTLTKKQ
ncbi:TnsD family Tn7-like transposition protein [Paraburkholderia caribensis]|uniref:TnsD family Tn7-like transposition protein n=1 Tax=Paraburkholderia caribensis TaxID=75105 RepID=UPI001D06DDD8|nr:TnsD family Tn7-like transposition protein [Paraburkholderia caribensis]